MLVKVNDTKRMLEKAVELEILRKLLQRKSKNCLYLNMTYKFLLYIYKKIKVFF